MAVIKRWLLYIGVTSIHVPLRYSVLLVRGGEGEGRTLLCVRLLRSCASKDC